MESGSGEMLVDQGASAPSRGACGRDAYRRERFIFRDTSDTVDEVPDRHLAPVSQSLLAEARESSTVIGCRTRESVVSLNISAREARWRPTTLHEN